MTTPPDTRPSDKALLKFWIGPVQSFVAAAKSARDLWTGSYLLAWLVSEAAQLVATAGGEFLVPAVTKLGGAKALRTPTLPNHFAALVPAENGHELARQARVAVTNAWGHLCDAVHSALRQAITKAAEAGRLPHAENWDRLWDAQVSDYFDVRTLILAPDGRTDAVAQLETANRLLNADKMVRKFPTAVADGDVPGKCSLLGDLEQMGPAVMSQSAAFWAALAEHVTIHGTRVRPTERLCAVSLVKRFAWAVALCERLGRRANQMPIPDTPRVAAADWLKKPEHSPQRAIMAYEVERLHSAAWLYWGRADQDPDDRPQDTAWEALSTVRGAGDPPPTYYAILNLDGDNMGNKFRNATSEGAIADISRQTSQFATGHVQTIVEDHCGTLVYGGGDDVLALLPTRRAVACAQALAKAFGQCVTDGTVSVGLAVVHHKEDLRYALEVSRRAEKAAKQAGRNRLEIAICRRSGEHSSTGLPWTLCDRLTDLVQAFVHGVSDRWTYKLRAELATLNGLPTAAQRAEVVRLLGRQEMASDARARLQWLVVDGLFDALMKHQPTQAKPTCDSPDTTTTLTTFVALCQSASFLARGRDQ